MCNFVLFPSLSLSLFRPGVPLSTQWGPQGYFYAIQIAQYGLSHFSKNLTERAPHVEVYDTAEEHNSKPNAWSVPKGCTLTTSYDKTRASTVRLFNAPGTGTRGTLKPIFFFFLCFLMFPLGRNLTTAARMFFFSSIISDFFSFAHASILIETSKFSRLKLLATVSVCWNTFHIVVTFI